MDVLAAITWEADPVLFQIGRVTVRWYGLLFALGFLLSLWLVRRMFIREGKPPEDVETLLVWIVAFTIIGARLVHCLAYEPALYLKDPLSILRVWEGGLASHGGALGIATAIWIHSRRREGQPFVWLLDRVAVAAALAGTCVRIGNFINSEIVGTESTAKWAVVFPRYNNPLYPMQRDLIPRHPAQLYEAAAYFGVFLLLVLVYRRLGARTPHGLLVGLFLAVAFAARFVIEFVKVRQAAWGGELPLSVGQLLSIPVVALGTWLVIRALRKGAPQPAS